MLCVKRPTPLPGSFILSAIRMGDWKAVYGKNPPAHPGGPDSSTAWRLYNLAVDAGESRDMSAERADILQRLVSLWDSYAQANGVFVHATPR